MTTTDYRPIACDLHSQLELWAMHREPVRLEDADGVHELCLVDVITHAGAEYLVTQDDRGQHRRIRLDHLRRIVGRRDGVVWCQASSVPAHGQ